MASRVPGVTTPSDDAAAPVAGAGRATRRSGAATPGTGGRRAAAEAAADRGWSAPPRRGPRAATNGHAPATATSVCRGRTDGRAHHTAFLPLHSLGVAQLRSSGQALLNHSVQPMDSAQSPCTYGCAVSQRLLISRCADPHDARHGRPAGSGWLPPARRHRDLVAEQHVLARSRRPGNAHRT